MKILLVDVDSKIPNLVLMKLSTYHKSKGDTVKLKKLNLNYYDNVDVYNIDGSNYDKVYVSIIFDNHKNIIKVTNCEDYQMGGVGYDLYIKLPDYIDSQELDYSIYPENDISYGFITRGCIRNCYFCYVPKKEGMIYRENYDLDKIIKHKQVKFLDNNILAYKGHKEILQELVDRQIKCQFNQGLDIRLIDDENALLLSKLNYINEHTFAFDDISYKPIIEQKLKILKKYFKKDWVLRFYIYINPNMDIIKDIMTRVNFCKENKILPYIMRDKSCWESNNNNFYIDLCAYCNQVRIIKKMEFEDFLIIGCKNLNRRGKNLNLIGKKEQGLNEWI